MQALGFILGPGTTCKLDTCVYYCVIFSALALLFQPLGDDGYEWDDAKLYFNLYTGPGFLGIFLSSLNIILIIFFFKEFDIHKTKTSIPLKRIFCCSPDNEKKALKSELTDCQFLFISIVFAEFEKKRMKKFETTQKKYDKIAAFVSIFLYFIIFVVFALGETYVV